MKIGVLGGTFDPVHLGHIMMAEEAKERLDLTRVIMMPTGRPVFRKGHRVTAAKHRLAMVRLAAESRPWLEVCDMETKRPGPSFTVDTITALKERLDGNDEIFFIIGWDSLAQLPGWREPARLVSLCRLVAVPRPGQVRPDIRALENAVPGISGRVIFLDKPCIDISASAIRLAVRRGESLRGLVPEKVFDYIKEHKLYVKSGGQR